MRETLSKEAARKSIATKLRKINYSVRTLPDIRSFDVPSRSKEIYHVMRLETVTWECTCPDYRFRRRQCKHIKKYAI